MTPSPILCGSCGRPLPRDESGGNCPWCLLAGALEVPQTLAAESAPQAPSPEMEPLQSEEAGAQVGRYRLLQKLGEGGFGIVYMAEQREPVKRRVALKIIKLGMDTRQVVARFEAERQALALMDHPNICKVLDGGATETGRPYFVMELVRGVPITRFCNETGLGIRERLELFIQVCQAVQHAHQKGIIHRDIKPSNVLVTLHDGLPVPKVIDFGIAKATQHELTEKTVFTQFHHLIGTPAYMSPEQAEMSSLDIDTRSDIYSLGVLLYELLVGRTPLDNRELLVGGHEEIRRRIREQDPAKPSTRVSTLEGSERVLVARQRAADPATLGSELRGDLDWIVLKALEKDRRRRYETANGFALDIRRHLDHEPVLAAPPSRLYQLGKYVRRHRAAVTGVASLAVVLILGSLISGWQAVRATRARNAARQAEDTARHTAYAAQMLVAQSDWDTANLSHLRRLLAETASHPDRGFEWYYWQRQCRLDLFTLKGHQGRIHQVAFSPDGAQLASVAGDRLVRLWDPRTGEHLKTLPGHAHPVWSVAFSPDGARLASADSESTVKVWDVTNGEVLWSVPAGIGGVTGVRFSGDARTLAASGESGAAVAFDSQSGEALRRTPPLDPKEVKISLTTLSPDLKTAAIGLSNGDIVLRDLETGMPRLKTDWPRPPEAGYHFIMSLAFSPDGARLALGAADATVRVVETGTGAVTLDLRNDWTRPEVIVAFSPSGSELAMAGDRTVSFRSLNGGPSHPPLKGHGTDILTLAYSPDGERLASGDLGGTIKLWSLDPQRERRRMRGHHTSLRTVAVSRDGRKILSSDWRERTVIWDADTGERWRELDVAGPSALFPDGRRLLAAQTKNYFGRNSLVMVDLDTGTKSPGPRVEDVEAVAVSPDGERMATLGRDRMARLWDVATGGELRAQAVSFSFFPFLAFSPDGSLLAMGGGDGVMLWRTADGSVVTPPRLQRECGKVHSAAFSPDGTQLVLGTDEAVSVWDLAGDQRLLLLAGHTRYVPAVGFSPDGKRLLSGSDDGTIRLWHSVTGRELMTLRAHPRGVVRAAFSPDGTRLVTASASEDATVSIWRSASRDQVTTERNLETGDRD